IIDARGKGLLVGIEFDDTLDANDVKHAILDRKMLVTAIGNKIIRMVPPLIVNKPEIDKAVDIIADAIASLSK
ncbi:aminotransferase class III-fold pyridoxal phosphate-dependent enzyme, partial [uncultured Ruminococcus sp.]